MIVFTDGEDEGSRLRIQDAIEAAQKADTICYVIRSPTADFMADGMAATWVMRKLREALPGA